MVDVAKNLKEVLGHLPEGVELVAISKYHPNEYILPAYEAGQRIFGESHEQELRQKVETLPKDIQWHFIGHLQTNKVRQVVGRVDLLESVDSARLLQAVEAQAARLDLVQDILLEVNVGGEASKSGVSPDEVPGLARQAMALPHVRLRGLMAIPPVAGSGGNRPFFAKMYQLYVDIRTEMDDNGTVINCLSMGMSGDYEDAVREGATLVRVGTALFGPRPPLHTR